jgi:hypothetical protein
VTDYDLRALATKASRYDPGSFLTSTTYAYGPCGLPTKTTYEEACAVVKAEQAVALQFYERLRSRLKRQH